MRTIHWMVLCCALTAIAPKAATAATPEEKAMAGRIATEIRESGKLSNYRIGVKFEDGVAVLMCSVTDKSQARSAILVAKQQEGVERVVNQLEIGEQAEQAQPSTEQTQQEESGLLLSMFKDQPAAGNKLQKSKNQPRMNRMRRPQRTAASSMPRPIARSRMGAPVQQASAHMARPAAYGGATPNGYVPGAGAGGASGVSYESPSMPGYAWPSYSAPQNYAALTYPRQYSPTAWPYIGPFYPYPQVPLGWRKVSLEWDDGWWFLDFSHNQCH